MSNILLSLFLIHHNIEVFTHAFTTPIWNQLWNSITLIQHWRQTNQNDRDDMNVFRNLSKILDAGFCENSYGLLTL